MSSMVPGAMNPQTFSLGSPLAPLDGLGDEGPSQQGFSGVLSNALQQVNQLAGSANQQVGALLQGGGTDVSSVMIAVEKADVSFQLMMQVRNKIVSAYQSIEQMQF